MMLLGSSGCSCWRHANAISWLKWELSKKINQIHQQRTLATRRWTKNVCAGFSGRRIFRICWIYFLPSGVGIVNPLLCCHLAKNMGTTKKVELTSIDETFSEGEINKFLTERIPWVGCTPTPNASPDPRATIITSCCRTALWKWLNGCLPGGIHRVRLMLYIHNDFSKRFPSKYRKNMGRWLTRVN